MKKIVALVSLFSVLLSTYNCAQSKEIQPEKTNTFYNSSKELIKNKQYFFIGDVVYTNKNSEKLNRDTNTIEINKSEVKGIVTSVKSENKTFNITGAIENYKASFEDDNEQIAITFIAKTEMKSYEIFIDVKSNGNAFLTVSAGNYNTISWTGNLKKVD